MTIYHITLIPVKVKISSYFNSSIKMTILSYNYNCSLAALFSSLFGTKQVFCAILQRMCVEIGHYFLFGYKSSILLRLVTLILDLLLP